MQPYWPPGVTWSHEAAVYGVNPSNSALSTLAAALLGSQAKHCSEIVPAAGDARNCMWALQQAKCNLGNSQRLQVSGTLLLPMDMCTGGVASLPTWAGTSLP